MIEGQGYLTIENIDGIAVIHRGDGSAPLELNPGEVVTIPGVYEQQDLLRNKEKPYAYEHDSGFVFNPDFHKLKIRNTEYDLTPTESRVLRLLVENCGKLVSFADFEEDAFKSSRETEKKSRNEIKNYISRLRRKLDGKGVKLSDSMIQTVIENGYSLFGEVTALYAA